VEGLGDLRAELLLADGYKSAAELASSGSEEIAAVLDVTPEQAQGFIATAALAAVRERTEMMVLRVATAIAEAAAALRAAAAEPTEPPAADAADAPAEAKG
jgi:hypothetical protein